MRIRSILRVIALTLVTCAFALVLSTCGSSHRVAPPLQSGGQAIQVADDTSLDDALAELGAYPCPEGVNAELFAELKDALGDALFCRARTCGAPLGDNAKMVDGGAQVPALQGGIKFVSTPPTGEANRVDDLELIDDGGIYTLSWHYKNLGDYDQNGTVGISDITPIAMHYGETYDREDANCLLAVIDGSGNGVVDIADITPIAMNYGVECVGYNVEGDDSATGSFNFIQEALQSEATGEGRLEFSAVLDELSWSYYRVVPYDGDDITGIPSNVVSVVPVIHSVSPLAGAAGTEVTFIAEIDGLLPLTYAWDFGGGATPNTSNDSEPTVTLGAAGSYSASLIVANAYGADDCDFTLNVELPPTITGVTPTGGDAGEAVIFSATVEGTPPFTYEWDFGGGATPNTSTDEEPYVILGLAGIYEASLTVTNVYDTDTFSFTITLWHVLTVDSIGAVGGHTSLAIINGNPAISYFDESNFDLKYVRASDASGGSWGIPVTVDSAGNVGLDTSLAVVNGNPAISYYDSANQDLKYVRANDASGGSWGTPVTVDSAGDVGVYNTSLAVVNGNPAISYCDNTNYDLKYARATDANGTSWNTYIVDSAGGVGYYTSLYVVNGNPAISYCDYTNFHLKYVRASDASGGSWGTPVTVESTGVSHTSLVVVNGNPAISYYCGNTDLKYVRASDASGGSWGTPVAVDSAGNVGEYTSLAVVNGNPAISYYDYTNHNLKYVRASDASGGSWGTPVAVDSAGAVGGHTSLAVVDGNPAISYLDLTNDDLKFAIGY